MNIGTCMMTETGSAAPLLSNLVTKHSVTRLRQLITAVVAGHTDCCCSANLIGCNVM